eukprot:TRINITY_DN12718_c0_g1_i1.p1 TRINITY_DN12718_c0_g1~~TRINITY_DN12718_c0_g1_i1.p1  ORF type:complete len:313 (+),score=65.50 TRINITY_DN12718_c0_g1_i1:102-941(+)
MKRVVGSRSKIRVLLSFLDQHYERDEVRESITRILVLLAQSPIVRTKIQQVGGSSAINIINNGLAPEQSPYVWNKHRKSWQRSQLDGSVSSIIYTAVQRGGGDIAVEDSDATVMKEKELTFKDSLKQLLNDILAEKTKEERIVFDIKVEDITFPTASTAHEFTVSPYIDHDNTWRFDFAGEPDFKITLSVKKKIKAQVTVSEISFRGSILVGFSGIRPAWFTFVEKPTLNFACKVTKQAVKIEKILRVIIFKIITTKFVQPKRFYLPLPKLTDTAGDLP